MRIKMKRFLGIFFSLALVLGLMPGMSLTAYADGTTYDPASEYHDYDNLISNDTEVTISEVSGKTWYVIGYNSTDKTVTLLSKQSFASKPFNSNTSLGNAYASSEIKRYVEGLTGEDQPLAGIKDALADISGKVTGEPDTISGAVPYLLSHVEAHDLRSTKKSGEWWLRSPGHTDLTAAFVDDGDILPHDVTSELEVRPALKLDLSKVTFDSNTNTFSLKPAYNVTLSGGANATTSGGAISQTGLTGAMTTVTYTANTGYYFAEFADITDNGITAKRTSSTVVTVSGTPTADATITVPDAVTNDEADDTQQNPDGTKTVTKENADGKTISVTNYSKTDEQISQFVFKKAKGTTLDLINVNSKTLKTVVVPESVKSNGNTYKVTRIRKGFLKNCEQATKVDIGKNINTIDKNAFNYGKKVQKVVIRGKLKKVGKNAFKNTKKNVVIKVKTNAKNFEKNKKLLEKSGLPTNATIKRVKNKK